MPVPAELTWLGVTAQLVPKTTGTSTWALAVWSASAMLLGPSRFNVVLTLVCVAAGMVWLEHFVIHVWKGTMVSQNKDAGG